MPEKTILLIDDSATIRRLVDTELSAAGFHVVLAPTAEDGLEKAAELKPDLIILDHQLPGTTGYDVSCQLLSNPDTAKLPIVASSTLRKKAYSEYVDCDNVVDMLPKPYTAEVLVATVQNALETAAMVVQSQSGGSAVPEVIDENGESDLAGNFESFSLREVIDLLNNGNKTGRLEIAAESFRVFIFCKQGRIQAVTASGIDAEKFVQQIPENMSELAPVMKSTLAGKKGSEIDGLVELLNNRVLDPRLLTKLLRIQAALLLKLCFTANCRNFRFDSAQAPPKLFEKLPLDSSLIALLVEAGLNTPVSQLHDHNAKSGFVRLPIRGQSVDRAGLTGKHMQFMKHVAEPATIAQLVDVLDWTKEEVIQVAWGYEMANLVEQTAVADRTVVYAVTDREDQTSKLQALQRKHEVLDIKIVGDCLALNLLMRRKAASCVLVDLSNMNRLNEFQALLARDSAKFADVRKLVTAEDSQSLDAEEMAIVGFDFVVDSDVGPVEMFELLTTNELATVAHAP